ncbi:protein NETWORKED 4B-like [Solanum verrucosum]|uniref:protein NETWORKED 4B-like n=1 Tax=Solanum verrucosum TaxID=315347 RepID=UPI0020D1089F|nr:protein NETWORKED 4B-like [Solanum verrucosum]
MKKMESKKLQRPRWLDSLFGPKNSNSQWLQENLEEMNRNFRRMLTIIEDSNAVSFAKKFEMYDQSRQELINLVDKCYRIHCLLAERYNHETGELLNSIPNSGLISSQGASNVSSGKISLPLLSKLHSSKQSNAHVSSVGSRQLKRGVSSIGNNNHFRGQISKNPAIRMMVLALTNKPVRDSSSSNFSNYYSDTQSDGGDDDDEEEELEAELRDMIVKLYIQLEGDRVDKALLEEKLDLNVLGLQSQQPVISDDSYTQSNDDDGEELQHEGTDELEAELRDMIEKLYIEMEGDRVVSMVQGGILRESISSNVDKALLEENLELQAKICRLLKDISSLEEYNDESYERCELLDEALSQARLERVAAEILFASEVEQLKSSIVKKNNDVEELNKILEAVAAERDQLKARVAMLDADPYKS